MVVKDQDVAFVKSGGSSNTNQNLSLGGDVSVISPGRNFTDNFLHNVFDEVTNDEAVSGEYEYRHAYYRNRKTYKVKNVRLFVVSDQTGPYSKIEFAKGTAPNGFIEQALIDENTGPAGISDSDWKIPSSVSPILLGDVEAGSTASFFMRRKVEVGALIAELETITIRIVVDPTIAPPSEVECPDGSHYDSQNDQCVQDPEPPDDTCPEGQHRDLFGICVDNTGQPCPDGQILQNGQCVDISTPPPPPEPVKILVTGDIGCNNDAEDVINTVPLFAPDMFIANGDLSYSSTINCFMDLLDENNLIEITKITIGNHDDEEDGSSRLRQNFTSIFQIPSLGYYGTTIQNVHIIFMDTQSDYSLNSPQYIAVRSDLQGAQINPSIDWIVVCYHKPSLTAPSDHAPLTDFRDIYHPLFNQYKVDLVIASHNHNMQRSFMIRYNPSNPSNPTIVNAASSKHYFNLNEFLNAQMFFVVGSGGRALDNISSKPAYMDYINDEDFGLLVLEFDNKILRASFVSTGEEEADINDLDVVIIDKTKTDPF